jgi:hypothetical protein
MRKTILMLLLCAPLLWVAWRECQRIYNVSSWVPQTSGAGDAEPAAKPQDLAEIKGRADAIVELPEGVARTIVRLDPPPARDLGTGPLASAVLEHAKEREKGRKVVEQARRDAADDEAKIEQARARLGAEGERPGGLVEEARDLETLLDHYQGLKVYDPELLASARAEAAWPALDKEHPASELDDFNDRLNRWTPVATEGESLGTARAREHETAYAAYVERHRAAKGALAMNRVRQASERLELWRRGAELAGVLEKPETHRARGITPAPIPGLAKEQKDRLDQIYAIVEIAKDEPPARFVETARRILQALCGDLLRPEPLENTVLVYTDSDAAAERCSRKLLVIRWKDQSRVTLEKSTFDEYTIPRDNIENFQLGDNVFDLPDDKKIRPLQGTDYSNAVHAFNLERAQIKQWSEPELARLRQFCEPHVPELSRGADNAGGRTLVARIDALLTVMRRHPNLFVATTP